MPGYLDSSNLETFQFRKGDIVISCGGKTGIHWLKHQITQMYSGAPEKIPPISRLVPWLEWRQNPWETNEERNEYLEKFDWSQTNGQRIFSTHENFGYGLPLKYNEDVKYIVSVRNPFDVLISLRIFIWEHSDEFWAEWGMSNTKQENGNIPGLIDALSSDRLPMMRFVLPIWPLRHKPNVFLTHYSDMKKDLPGHIRKLSQFLGVDLDEETFQKVVDHSQFGWMKTNFNYHDGLNYKRKDGTLIPCFTNPDGLLRKGAINEESSELTADQREKFDQYLKKIYDPDLYRWSMEGGPLP